MPVITEQKNDHYLAEYERLERARADRSWFAPVRKAAIAHFADQGFPTTRHEEWRYTNVSTIARTPFRLAVPTATTTPEMIAPFLFDPHPPEYRRVGMAPASCSSTGDSTTAYPTWTVCRRASRSRTSPGC